MSGFSKYKKGDVLSVIALTQKADTIGFSWTIVMLQAKSEDSYAWLVILLWVNSKMIQRFYDVPLITWRKERGALGRNSGSKHTWPNTPREKIFAFYTRQSPRLGESNGHSAAFV